MSDVAKPSMSMSISRKVNLGNYESADVFVSIQGITEDTTPEQIDSLLDMQDKIVYAKLRECLKGKIRDVMDNRL